MRIMLSGFLFLLVLVNRTDAEVPVLLLNEMKESTLLTPYSVASIVKGEAKPLDLFFIPADSIDYSRLDYSKSAWFIFKIKNTKSVPISTGIKLHQGTHLTELFIGKDDSLKLLQKNGMQLSPSKRPFSEEFYHLPFAIPTGTHTFYIKVKMVYSMSDKFSFSLLPINELETSIKKGIDFYRPLGRSNLVIVIGIAFLLIFVLILGLQSRLKAQLFYAFYLFSILLYFLSELEKIFSVEIFFRFIPNYFIYLWDFFFAILPNLAYYLFLKTLLKATNTKINVILNHTLNIAIWITGIGLVAIAILIFPHLGEINRDIYAGVRLFGILINLIIVVLIFRIPNKIIRLFAYGSLSILVFSMGTFFVSVANELAGKYYMDHPMILAYVGIFLELVFFSLAIGHLYRQNFLEKEQLENSLREEKIKLQHLFKEKSALHAELKRSPIKFYGKANGQLSLEETFLQKIYHLVETNINDENFGIREVCSALHISRSQLHRKLKSLTGHSTSYVLRTIRLQYARKLLETSEMNVSQIAYEVGFKDVSYFTKLFKEEFNQLPSSIGK